MLFAILLAVQTGIAPAQSAAADAVAVQYLTRACSDGKERFGVVTADDGVLHDLSVSPGAVTVVFDDAALRPLCRRSPLIPYHCHTTDDPVSLFPGFSVDNDASDFGTAAFMEYVCALEASLGDFMQPVIEHRLVHTGGAGTVVRYGIRGSLRDRARSLGVQMAEASQPPTVRVGHMGVPIMTGLTEMPSRIRAVHTSLSDLFALIRSEYSGSVLLFRQNVCPDGTTEEAIRACPGFTLAAYAATLDPCGGYAIVPPGSTGPASCQAARGERIGLGGPPRYAGWEELTPDSYDAFTARGSVVLAYCDETGEGIARTCGTLLAELNGKLPDCNGLKRAYVDVSRYPELRNRHTDGFQEAALLQDGRRYVINVSSPSEWLFKLILCGPEALFKGVAF